MYTIHIHVSTFAKTTFLCEHVNLDVADELAQQRQLNEEQRQTNNRLMKVSK